MGINNEVDLYQLIQEDGKDTLLGKNKERTVCKVCVLIQFKHKAIFRSPESFLVNTKISSHAKPNPTLPISLVSISL